MSKLNDSLEVRPRVSIIVPTFNRRQLLKESLESVLRQSFQDFEVIVVDDGSTDNTEEMIRNLNSPKIRYVYQSNRGRSNARNQALKLVRGEFIAFNDSDDLFLPNKLQIQVDLMDKNPGVGMLYSTARCLVEGKEIYSPYLTVISGNIYPYVAFYMPLVVLLPTVMIRRQIQESAGTFDESLDRFEDTDMWRRVSKLTPAIGIEEPLVIVRTHDGNTMEEPELLKQRIDKYVDKVFAEDGGRHKIWKRVRASDLYQTYAFAVLKHPKYYKFADPFLKKSLQYWPLRYDVPHVIGCIYQFQKKRICFARLLEAVARVILAGFTLFRPWRAVLEHERCRGLKADHLTQLKINP